MILSVMIVQNENGLNCTLMVRYQINRLFHFHPRSLLIDAKAMTNNIATPSTPTDVLGPCTQAARLKEPPLSGPYLPPTPCRNSSELLLLMSKMCKRYLWHYHSHIRVFRNTIASIFRCVLGLGIIGIWAASVFEV